MERFGVEIMTSRDKEPLFSISVAARLIGISPRVLRSYEDADLIRPYRTKGKTRLYSKQDIRRLQIINYLHKQKEVNLSGIKVILEIVANIPVKEKEKEGDDIVHKIREIAPHLLPKIEEI